MDRSELHRGAGAPSIQAILDQSRSTKPCTVGPGRIDSCSHNVPAVSLLRGLHSVALKMRGIASRLHSQARCFANSEFNPQF